MRIDGTPSWTATIGRRRCHWSETRLIIGYPLEPVIQWLVFGDGSMRFEGRPRHPDYQVDELLEGHHQSDALPERASPYIPGGGTARLLDQQTEDGD